MRVLALVPEAFGGRGGIARYNRDLLISLCTHPKCTDVVAAPRIAREETAGLPHGLQWVSEATGGLCRFSWQVLKRVLRGPQFDLIVCAHINLLPIAWTLRVVNRAPIVLIVYGIDSWRPTGRVVVDELAKRLADVVSISGVTRDRFISWSTLAKENVTLIPNAVHLEQYGPGAPKPDLVQRYGLSDCCVLLTVARLWQSQRHKGIDDVLNVLPELVGQVPNLKYLLCGEGDDAERLRHKASQLGVADRVVFAGYIDERELPDHYRLAQAFAMPGRGEGFGFVFLEAMACGIPVVASKLDGSREAVMNGQLGILVDPRDRSELKDGIIQALGQPRKVPEQLAFFSFENFEKRLHVYIDNIIKKYSI